MCEPFLMSEGFHVDNAGNLILVIYVDFRRPSDRVPITTLIKGCDERYAIERCNKIHLSKPKVFRNIEKGLIGDTAEAKQSSTNPSGKLNEQNSALRAQSANNKSDLASEPMETPSRHRVDDGKITPTTTESLTSDKSGWIFCTSIEPTNQSDKDKWQESVREYDHTSYIRHPREFARVLGSMVAEQCGPQGDNGSMRHTFGNNSTFNTKHKGQVIYHGPVVYADGPYDVIFSSTTETAFTLLPLFIKDRRFQDQREYRFAIMTSKEPAKDTVDLDVSSAMLEAMQGRHGWFTPQIMPDVLSPEKSSSPQKVLDERNSKSTVKEAYGPQLLDSLRTKSSLNSTIRDLANDPATPITPNTCDLEKLPSDLYEAVTTYAALDALRDSIGGITGTGRLSGTRYIEAASSAWHADPCIRSMCATFEDPIANISINDKNAVIIRLKFPNDSKWNGHIAICPDGYGKCVIESDAHETTGFDRRVNPLRNDIVKLLKQTDIHIRHNSNISSDPNPEK